jgi:succinate dehydrogenase flavin-adding protein (antitoxin of CptAB toxin-antitoxin module)
MTDNTKARILYQRWMGVHAGFHITNVDADRLYVTPEIFFCTDTDLFSWGSSLAAASMG